MTLREVDAAPGAPWGVELRGRLERLVVESDLLAGNPLGDPARRPLYVYLPPGVERDAGRRYPVVYVIQGFTGQLDMWVTRNPFEPNMFERADELFSDPEIPPAVLVFVDAWTSVGGSQFINSIGTGPYMDYLCDEVVTFVDGRFPTIPDADHRALTGKSSGGYGAMVVPMLRRDTFGALATHAGDALFDVCYMCEFREAARNLRDNWEGSFDRMWEELRAADHMDWEKFQLFEVYGYALCYSPDPDRPGKPLLPFDVGTGALVPEVWTKWLEWDPIRIAPAHLDDLASMKHIYIDAGKSDEYFLDLGATAFSKVLEDAGIDHFFELFDGKHGGMQYRYPKALRQLALALDPA